MEIKEDDLKLAIQNGTLKTYIKEYKNEVLGNKNIINNISLIKTIIGDKDIRDRIKSGDIVEIVTSFCKRLENINEDVLLERYLRDMKELQDYLNTVDDVLLIQKLNEYMVITKIPIVKITTSENLYLYWRHFTIFFRCKLKYSRALLKNIVSSFIGFLNSYFNSNKKLWTMILTSDIFKWFRYIVSALKNITPDSDREILYSFVTSAFEVILLHKMKFVVNEPKSNFEVLLGCVFCQAEINIGVTSDLSKTLKSIKCLEELYIKSLDEVELLKIMNKFYDGVTKISLDDFPKILDKFVKKEKSNNLIESTLLHIYKFLRLYFMKSLLNYSKPKSISIIKQVILTCHFILDQMCNDVVFSSSKTKCCKCNSNCTSSRFYVYIAEISISVISNLQTLHKHVGWENLHDSFHSTFQKYYYLIKDMWIKNCDEKINQTNNFLNYYFQFCELLCRSHYTLKSDNISFVKNYLKRTIQLRVLSGKQFASTGRLNYYLKQSFDMLFNLHMESKDFKKAMVIHYLGVHFTTNTSFQKLFHLKYNESDCKHISSYDLLTDKSILDKDKLNVVLEKHDFVQLLLIELKEHYKYWISFHSMLPATRALFKLTDDPIILAKACVFLEFRKKPELSTYVNKASESLESALQEYTGYELTIASILLASLNCMKYSAKTEIFRKELSQGLRTVQSAHNQQINDRDGLIDPNDTCEIDPAVSRLNINSENSIVQYLANACALWKTAIKNLKDIPENDSCYLTQALSHMEFAVLSFAERGCESYKINLCHMMIVLSTHLDKKLEIIKCTSRLLSSMIRYEELEPLISTADGLVSEYMKNTEPLDVKTKSIIYDYLLSYSEYKWNSKDYLEGFIIYEKITTIIMEDKTCSELIKAKLHWLRSLYLQSPEFRTEHVEFQGSAESLSHVLTMIRESLEAFWKTPIQVTEISESTALYYDMIIKAGRYFLNVYMHRLANAFLRPAVKLAEKDGYAHRLADMLCILSKVDLICEKFDNCQVKLTSATDVLFPGWVNDKRTISPVMKTEEKLLDSLQIRVTRAQVSQENFRDSNHMVPGNKIKLLKNPAVGSPALHQRVLKLPEFLHHTSICSCIDCHDTKFHALIVELITTEARLNGSLGNISIAEHYFKTCKYLVNVVEDKHAKMEYKHRLRYCLNIYDTFKAASAIYSYDHNLYLAKHQKDQQDTINVSLNILTKMFVINRQILQDVICLKVNLAYDSYQNNKSKREIVKNNSKSTTPVKLLTTLAYKTPVGTKLLPKCKPKFVIHEDMSPIAFNKPKIKFDLDDQSSDHDENVNTENKFTKSRSKTKSSDSSNSDQSVYQTPNELKPKCILKNGKSIKNTRSITKNKKILEIDDEVFEDYKTPAKDNVYNKRSCRKNSVDQKEVKKSDVDENIYKTPNTKVKKAITKSSKRTVVPKSSMKSIADDFKTPIQHFKSRDFTEDDVFYSPMENTPATRKTNTRGRKKIEALKLTEKNKLDSATSCEEKVSGKQEIKNCTESDKKSSDGSEENIFDSPDLLDKNVIEEDTIYLIDDTIDDIAIVVSDDSVITIESSIASDTSNKKQIIVKTPHGIMTKPKDDVPEGSSTKNNSKNEKKNALEVKSKPVLQMRKRRVKNSYVL